MTLAAVTALAIVGLLGWLGGSGGLAVALAQEGNTDRPPAGGTPSVLPRPDFHFPVNVRRTDLDSDPPRFRQPVQAPKACRTSCSS
jgi:arylsulfatase